MNPQLPGELVTVDGDLLHVVSEGAGTPPLLLSAGLGGAWFDWISVAERLRDRHRVVSFDRPGLGGSPPGRRFAGLREEANRLAGLAVWTGAPVIMIAHSFAAFHAEAFARLYPELVHGMVLVDPSAEPHEPPHARRLSRLAPFAGVAGRAAGLSGLLRLAGPLVHRMAMRRMTEHTVAPHGFTRAVYTRPHVLGTILVELAGYRQAAADLLTLRRSTPFPAIPLCVITALGDAEDEGWIRAHAALAALSPHGRQIVLPGSGHLVHVGRPEVVVEAVRRL